TRVVLPWSTWAMIATLRMSARFIKSSQSKHPGGSGVVAGGGERFYYTGNGRGSHRPAPGGPGGVRRRPAGAPAMASNLYLNRHGEATPLGPDIAADDARPLTDKGKAQAAALAQALQRAGVTLDRLITSPLLRARQTAEGILEHWNGTKPELLVSQALAP